MAETQIRPQTRDGVELADLIDSEVYYGFNLRVVLAEATQEERDTIRQVFERARTEREEIASRLDGNRPKIKIGG